MPGKIKRILFINQTFGLGGAETFNTELLSWFRKQNISVAAYVNYPRFVSQLRSSGIETVKVLVVADVIGDWKGLVKSVVAVPVLLLYYLSVLLHHRNTDVIIMSGFIEKILVTPLAVLFRIPVVWWEFSSLKPVFSKFFGLPRLMYSLVESLPALVIAPSTNTFNALSLETAIPKDRLVFIPIARTVKKTLPVTPVQPGLITCVSRLEPGKGQDLLIQAFAKICSKFPAARLKIVGEGDFLPRLQQLVTEYKISDKVTFTGWVDSALSEISRADIYVFPSVWDLEGFGITVLEAMAFGKPVIAFPVGAVADMLTARTGIILPKGDLSALSQALASLLSSPSRKKALGKAALTRYQSSFTFAVIAPRYLDIIERSL